MKIIVLFSFLFLFSSYFVPKVFAQVLITEVYPNPNTGETEWVELYNSSNEPVSLTGWILEDQLSTPSILKQWSTETIQPLTYLTIDLSSAKLNNAADGITLKNSSGTIVNSMSYASSETSKSWALITDYSLPITGTWILGSTTKGTANPQPPPSPSPIPTPTPTPIVSPNPSPNFQPCHPELCRRISSYLSLSRIMPCPNTGEPEWIELYNDSDQEINVTGWKLNDASSAVKQWSDETIAAHSYIKVELQSSRLNNTGDTLTLEAPDGTIAFEETYSSCTKGQPLVKMNGEWKTEAAAASPNPSMNTESRLPKAEEKNIMSANGYRPTTNPVPSLTNWTPINYNPKLLTTSSSLLPRVPVEIAAPTPDVKGSASVIIGGLLLSGSSSFALVKKIIN